MHPNSCSAVFRSYYANGETPVKKKSPGRPPHPVPDEIKEYLLSSLTDNRFLSLRERVRDIQLRFKFNMNYDRLRKFFRREGVSYKRCKSRIDCESIVSGSTVMKRSTLSPIARQKARKEFAAKLVTLMKRKSFLYIVDESSVNLWSRSRVSHTWV